MFAYEITGGSNLDLPAKGYATDGREIDLVEDVYKKYTLVLCISTYSATAPLTAFAKQYGFRGATMHGMNQVILSSGLAVDYFEVSKQAEKLRLGMTRADWVEIDYVFDNQRFTLRLELGRQEAQKSHGLCRGGADIANLPAGEIYYVPKDASGQFPHKYEDGTIGLMTVTGGRIKQAALLTGSQATIDAHNQKLTSDPVTGELGELGFGTQELPVSGRDIQDEKTGTLGVHVATGRSDHLGGYASPIGSPTKRTPRTTTSFFRRARRRRLTSRKYACIATARPSFSSRTTCPLPICVGCWRLSSTMSRRTIVALCSLSAH